MTMMMMSNFIQCLLTDCHDHQSRRSFILTTTSTARDFGYQILQQMVIFLHFFCLDFTTEIRSKLNLNFKFDLWNP